MLSRVELEFLEELASNDFSYDLLDETKLKRINENLKLLEIGEVTGEKSFYDIKEYVALMLVEDKVQYKVDDNKPNKVYFVEAYEALLEICPNLQVAIENYFKIDRHNVVKYVHVTEGIKVVFGISEKGDNSNIVDEHIYEIPTGKKISVELFVEKAEEVAPEVIPSTPLEDGFVHINDEEFAKQQNLLNEVAREQAREKEKGSKKLSEDNERLLEIGRQSLDNAANGIRETLEKLEEKNMKNKNVAVADVSAKIKKAKKGMADAARNARVQFGADREALVGSFDESINSIKDAFSPVLEVLDDALGCTSLKEEICGIIYSTLNGAKKSNDFFTMAKLCREAVENRIIYLSKLDPTDKVGSVAKLRTLVQKGQTIMCEDGSQVETENEYETQTIWMAFASALVLVCKKIARKFKKWFGTTAETNIFGATGAAIAGFFEKIGNVVKNAARVAGNVLLYVGSYMVAGVLLIGGMVVKAIKWVYEKVKAWFVKKNPDQETDAEEFDEDDVLDDIEESDEIEEEIIEEVEAFEEENN